MTKPNSPADRKRIKAIGARKPGSNTPKALGYDQFAWIPLEMMNSPAYWLLSRGASQFLWAILREHTAQGGQENGKLIVTHEQAKALKISGSAIRPAIEELEFLGFISFTQGGRYNGSNQPNRYRIAWLWSKDKQGANVAPTDVWKTRTETEIKAYRRELTQVRKAKRARRRNHAADPPPSASR